MLPKIDAAPLHERVYQEIRRALMAGLYPLGQSFSLAQIAGELGTSVMPVREALNRLAAERAVEILPKRGVIVRPITPEKYRELIEVRLQLEGMATELGAKNITNDEILALQQITDRMNALRDDQTKWQEFNLLNYDFHFSIYQSGKTYILPPLIEILWLQTGPLLNIYQKVGMLPNSNRHEVIVAALRARDPAASRLAVSHDILAGYQYISTAYGWDPLPLRF